MLRAAGVVSVEGAGFAAFQIAVEYRAGFAADAVDIFFVSGAADLAASGARRGITFSTTGFGGDIGATGTSCGEYGNRCCGAAYSRSSRLGGGDLVGGDIFNITAAFAACRVIIRQAGPDGGCGAAAAAGDGEGFSGASRSRDEFALLGTKANADVGGFILAADVFREGCV